GGGELEAGGRRIDEVAEDERRLTRAEQHLVARTEEFRARRSILSATYTAAEAQVRVDEALGGISGELAELYLAVGRAEEKTERMRARASAVDQLAALGPLAPIEGD